MWEDPIVAEVHRIRQELAAKFNHYIQVIFNDIRQRQAALGDLLVRRPEKKYSKLASSQVHDADPGTASGSVAQAPSKSAPAA